MSLGIWLGLVSIDMAGPCLSCFSLRSPDTLCKLSITIIIPCLSLVIIYKWPFSYFNLSRSFSTLLRFA